MRFQLITYSSDVKCVFVFVFIFGNAEWWARAYVCLCVCSFLSSLTHPIFIIVVIEWKPSVAFSSQWLLISLIYLCSFLSLSLSLAQFFFIATLLDCYCFLLHNDDDDGEWLICVLGIGRRINDCNVLYQLLYSCNWYFVTVESYFAFIFSS